MPPCKASVVPDNTISFTDMTHLPLSNSPSPQGRWKPRCQRICAWSGQEERYRQYLPQGVCEPVEIGPLPAYDAVCIFGLALGAVADSGNPSDHQILHSVAVEDLDQTSEIVWRTVR